MPRYKSNELERIKNEILHVSEQIREVNRSLNQIINQTYKPFKASPQADEGVKRWRNWMSDAQSFADMLDRDASIIKKMIEVEVRLNAEIVTEHNLPILPEENENQNGDEDSLPP